MSGSPQDGTGPSACAQNYSDNFPPVGALNLGVEQAQVRDRTPLVVSGEDACCWSNVVNVVQRASQSAAAAAVNKLAVRLAAGSGRLADLVRNDQDLAAEAEALDKTILAAVAKEPAKRDAAAEQRTRDQLAEIAKQRAALQGVFATAFPD